MEDLQKFRREWSARQKDLREQLKSGNSPDQARELFYTQHRFLHSKKISEGSWSYADEIICGLDEDLFRVIPKKKDHSLIWILWHISRIEDITMNILVAGGEQVYLHDGWKKRIGSPLDHTGNAISAHELKLVSESLDPAALLEYRIAVGTATRAVIKGMPSDVWNTKVHPDRLERLIDEGAVLPQAQELLYYWGKRRIFELFLMPPTRHLMVHLNEAYSLVRTLGKVRRGE